MRYPLEIPRTFDEITAEWLTAALRRDGVIKDATVESVDTHVIGLSAGYTTELARLIPHYSNDEPSAPLSIIAKLPSLDEVTQAMGTSLHLFERESRFYSEIGAESGMRVPTRYYGAMNVRQVRHVLLLEDFGRVGLDDRSAVCSVDEAARALTALARMHAKWWNSEKLDEYAWLASATSRSLVVAYHRKFEQGWDAVRERFSGRLPPGTEQIGDRLLRVLDDVYQASNANPVTLVHGTYRPENIHFDRGEDAEDVAVVSWQFVGRRQGATDVSYFIPYSLPLDVRREQEERLLHHYREALIDFGVPEYSFDELVRHYRLGLLRNLVLFVVGDENLDLAVSNSESWNTRRVESLVALEDWDCGEILEQLG